jgi:hypothetical protein
MLLDDGAAFTGSRFKAAAIEHDHAPVAVIDQSCVLECADGERDGPSADPNMTENSCDNVNSLWPTRSRWSSHRAQRCSRASRRFHQRSGLCTSATERRADTEEPLVPHRGNLCSPPVSLTSFDTTGKRHGSRRAKCPFMRA